jgi:FdrA protein
MPAVTRLLRNEYLDSLVLMHLSNEVSSWPGVRQAVLVMGTESNRRILEQVGLLTGAARTATPQDLVIAAELEPSLGEAEFMARLEERMRARQRTGSASQGYSDLVTALRDHPEARLVSISLPGEHAAVAARQALELDRHVFCFSQHVTLEDELALKKLAVERGLLMMGPDCGTAIVDGVGLGFANRVRSGSIGLVSASGSGLQEVVCLIHRAGAGISQAIGVGGRDLRAPLNGIMAEAAVQWLGQDSHTQVIVLLAKSASVQARQRVLEAARASGKPTVVDFLSGEIADLRPSGAVAADTFEKCASEAVRLSGLARPLSPRAGDSEGALQARAAEMPSARRFVRGLYAGGSLCGEATHILEESGIRAATNLEAPLSERPAGHLIVDLGAEEYTQGRAHPFIDPRLRSLEIQQAFADESVGILLMDIVLGLGCHPDPAGAVIEALQKARDAFGTGPVVIACLCGTPEDPQGYDRQLARLLHAGVYVAGSHAAAAQLAARLATLIEVKHG